MAPVRHSPKYKQPTIASSFARKNKQKHNFTDSNNMDQSAEIIKYLEEMEKKQEERDKKQADRDAKLDLLLEKLENFHVLQSRVAQLEEELTECKQINKSLH